MATSAQITANQHNAAPVYRPRTPEANPPPATPPNPDSNGGMSRRSHITVLRQCRSSAATTKPRRNTEIAPVAKQTQFNWPPATDQLATAFRKTNPNP